MNLSAVDDEEDEWKEGWALDRLCEALLGRGGLVPVSKKCVPHLVYFFFTELCTKFLSEGNAPNRHPKSLYPPMQRRGRTF